jgi:hypothetical protein
MGTLERSLTSLETDHPYSVTLTGDLPVSAYIWLKNYQIPHRVLFSWHYEDRGQQTVLEFEHKEHAAWFALRWS